jgi:plastocyanin
VIRREIMSGIVMLACFPLVATASAATRPSTHPIVIEKMRFGAVPANIHAGDTIVWINRDVVAHTATARNGSFDVELPAGASVRMVAATAGKIPFYCRYHPTMQGSLVVAR